jgi:hypothetical protein
MASDSFGPVCPPLASPVAPPEHEWFVVPPRVSVADCEAAANKAIRESFLRPADIGRAEIERARLLYVPFWRVDATVDGFYIGLTHGTTSAGRSFVLPNGGAKHRDDVLAICARRLFPYQPPRFQVAPFLASGFGTVGSLQLRLEEMVPRSSHPLPEGSAIDADLTRAEAEREARELMLHAVRPTSALYSSYEPRVRSAVFVHYPIVLVRYRYQGEAAPQPGAEFHVGVSARTGKIVTSKHPSAVRALAAKFRRLLTL